MRMMLSCAALSLALIGGCGTNQPTNDHGSSTGDETGGAGPTEPGGGSGGTAATCPLGVDSFTAVLGLSDIRQNLDLAVDVQGNAFVGAALPEVAGDQLIAGVTEVSATGNVSALLAAGSLVATDAAGDIFVAGSFTSTIDLGAGAMVPEGNIDIFVAKLDAQGRILFVKQLGLCGDGLTSMAIARDGRIAISGSAIGTVILSPSGELQLTVAASGHIAFDSHGNLVIAETLQAGIVIEKLDAAGNVLFSASSSATVQLTGIAIGASDTIAIAGTTFQTAELFGTTITVHFNFDGPGRVDGGFVIELDGSCAVTRVVALTLVQTAGLAFDAAGHVFVVGASAGSSGLERFLGVNGIDVALPASVVRLLADGNAPGVVSDIAFDACNSMLLTFVQLDSDSAIAPQRAVVAKLAP